MAVVAGVDFGTLSVGSRFRQRPRRDGWIGHRIGQLSAEAQARRPGFRYAIPSGSNERAGHAMREVLAKAGIPGEQVEAIALDTTGSSVVPVDAGLSRSMTTICGATIAPRERRSRSRNSPTASIWKQLNGAAGSTPMSGDSPSCCTGCATIRKSVVNWRAPLNTATWWRRLSAALPTPGW